MKPLFHTLLAIALLLVLAAPSAAHLQQRGTPLSELAASSPIAVIGSVTGLDQGTVELKVEESVLGKVSSKKLSFRSEGHHPPRYELGARILVFLSEPKAPFSSRQTPLDRVEVPSNAHERGALVTAVRAYAALRALDTPQARLAKLKELSLAQLSVDSTRLRHEALLDLVAIAPRVNFSVDDVRQVVALTENSDTPDTLGPGLVVLLASIPTSEADRALYSVMEKAAQGHTRARAARVIGTRHGALATAELQKALQDPSPVVRATAERALAKLATKAASKEPSNTIPTNKKEGSQNVDPQAARN